MSDVQVFIEYIIIDAFADMRVQLDPDGLIKALTQRPFIIYAVINIALMVIFVILSASSASRDWVFIDVGLCALFGT